MLFYFCETCGKRITDQQILDGLGSDKKLKGVYCKSCAVGVHTMEFEAISEEELKKPIRKSSGAALIRTSREPQRSTPPTGAVTPHTKTHPSKSVIHPPRPAQSGTKVYAAAAGTLVMLTLLIFVSRAQLKSTGRNESHPTAPLVEPAPPVAPRPVPATTSDSLKEIALPPLMPSTTFIVEPAETKAGQLPDTRAKADYDTLVKQVGALEKGDSAGRLALVDAFLKDHAGSPVAESAQTLRDGIVAVDQYNKTHAVLDGVPDLKPSATGTPAAKVVDATVPDPKVDAELATQKMVQDAYTLLSQSKIPGAMKATEQHPDAPAAARGLLKSALESLQKRDTLWHEALVKTVGRKVKLETKTGVVEGTVLSADSDLLKIDKPLMLDGEVKGSATVVVAVADILPASRDIVTLPAPSTQEEWVAQTLTCLMRHESTAAEAALGHCDDYALQSALRNLASTERAAAREAQAQAQWKKAEDLFANAKWKPAKQAYEALQHDFSGTAVVNSNADTIAKRMEKIDEALLATQAVTLDLGGGVKLDLMPIAAGEFEMGSNDGDANEKPVHKVKITKPFLMGKYVVTQAQYEKVMGSNPCLVKGDNLAVDRVNFGNALDFCKKLSKLSGKNVRLPTEAEWEYACRAGTKTKYYFGDNDALLDQAAWYANNSAEKVNPVGLKKPNAWGLYDMYGNVFQICADTFEADYYSKSPPEDPECMAGANAVLRGGCRICKAFQCRSAARNAVWRGEGSFYMPYGFRIVVSAPKSR